MSGSEDFSGLPQQGWPTVELDPVRRLRVLAAAGRHRIYAERVFPGSFGQVWSVAADLEGELPGLITGLRSFSVTPAAPGSDRLHGRAVSVLGHREQFDVVLRPGWCLMQSRTVVGGMAAVEESGGVRFALFGGVRLRGIDPLRRFLPVGTRKGEVLMNRLEQRIRSLGAAETD